MNVMDVVTPWVTVNESLGLNGPIRDEEHYQVRRKTSSKRSGSLANL